MAELADMFVRERCTDMRLQINEVEAHEKLLNTVLLLCVVIASVRARVTPRKMCMISGIRES